MDLNKLEKNAAQRITEADVFSRRFGSFGKADYEVLMFTIYLDSLPPDQPVFDYLISQELGITESKVRMLRTKSQLIYKREINWQNALAAAIDHGRYIETDNTVIITVEDPSCLNRIRYEIESTFGSVGLNLNSKQLRLPVECLLTIALEIDHKNEETILAQLNETWLKTSREQEAITKDSLKKRVLKGSKELVGLLNDTAGVWTGAATIIAAVSNLIK